MYLKEVHCLKDSLLSKFLWVLWYAEVCCVSVLADYVNDHVFLHCSPLVQCDLIMACYHMTMMPWKQRVVKMPTLSYFPKLIIRNSHLVTHCKIALHRASLINKSTLIQVMAWCQQPTSHYLIQCWHRSTLPSGITQPQWVNSFISIDAYILVNEVGYHWFRWWFLICWVPNHFLINLLAKSHYSSGAVFYLLSWSPSHLAFFLQVTWSNSIFTPSDLEAKSLGEIPSDFGCWLADIFDHSNIVICILYLSKLIIVTVVMLIRVFHDFVKWLYFSAAVLSVFGLMNIFLMDLG